MPKIAFLILNFKNFEETEKCVFSIETLNLKDYFIVIVDNGSKDGSAEKIAALCRQRDNCFFVESPENVGFSCGNNLGYAFIRKNLDVDFIVVTNNDVLFPQRDFAERLVSIYEEKKFHVLGPDIYIRANREHQSPMMLSLPSKQQLQNELGMYEYYQTYPEKWVSRRKIQSLKNRLCQSIKPLGWLYDFVKGKKRIDYLRAYENCCVQGACIIVSKKYLDAEEKMFSPEPFLFCEELFFFKKCMSKSYVVCYDPRIQIWHEDSSTMKKISRNALEKAKFTLHHHVLARKMLVEYWNQLES